MTSKLLNNFWSSVQDIYKLLKNLWLFLDEDYHTEYTNGLSVY